MFDSLKRKIGDFRLNSYQREQERKKRDHEKHQKELEKYRSEKIKYEHQLERERAKEAFLRQKEELRRKRLELKHRRLKNSGVGKAFEGVGKFADHAIKTTREMAQGLEKSFGNSEDMFMKQNDRSSRKSKKHDNDDFQFPF